MTVTSGLWWSVWWPWMTTWIVTVIAIATTVTITVHARGPRRRALHTPGAVYYVDGPAIQTMYAGPAKQKVKIETLRKRGAKFSLGYNNTTGGLDQGSEHTESREGELIITPQGAISTVLKKLDSNDELVLVDLDEKHVIRNNALGDRPRQVQLSQLRGAWISLTADFHITDRGDNAVLVAHYGGTAGIRIPIGNDDNELTDLPTSDSFHGRCIATIENWDAQNDLLTIKPIAIFQ